MDISSVNEMFANLHGIVCLIGKIRPSSFLILSFPKKCLEMLSIILCSKVKNFVLEINKAARHFIFKEKRVKLLIH